MALNVDMSRYDQQGCLHDMFVKQALQTPHKVAIVSAEGRQITFEELNQVTDSLAHHLRSLGVGRNKVVGILMERCVEYTISLIAILKAGGAYLPIEMSYPSSLIQSVLEDAQPIVICTKHAHAHRLICFDIPLVKMEEDALEVWKPHNEDTISLEAVLLDDMAYTVYSSGTTGKPKGIQCPHRGAVFSYTWRHLAYPYEPNEREACNIFFVWEMLRPLLKGTTLYVIPDTVIYDPPQLIAFLLKNAITRMLFTPSLLQTILDTQQPSVLVESFKSFKQIWLCGEVVTTTLRNRFASIIPWVRILNLYSISECHDVSCSDLTDGSGLEDRSYCPVGRIFPLVRVLVMDKNFNENAPGDAGEIFIGGPTLAIGYLNLPDLNEERFIDTPPHLAKAVGPRLYRTGDWGYLLGDGSLEVIGRCDSMVKIRGYTIELKAVENALLNIPEVNMACAVVVGPEGSDKMLVAYVVLNPGFSTNNTGVLRSKLKAQLPFYMIPSQFIFLDKLPLLGTSGKIDKKELPQARLVSEEDIDLGDDLMDETSKSIAKIWCKVLRTCTVDKSDNFFDLGGHSLLAAVVVGKLNEIFGTVLSTLDMYANPTLEALAKKVNTGENSDVNDVDLLKELEKYSVRNVPNVKLRTFWKSANYLKCGFDYSRVLLTGAVGFLGSFILQKLLNSTQATVFCLIRSSAEQSAQERLLSTFKSRSLSQELLESRLVLVTGNIALNKFGLEEAEYTALCQDIDAVIHCAAYVNMVLPYTALAQANVVGTHNVVSFCLEEKLKPLHYISTNDVFPAGTENCSEDSDMLAHACKLLHGYAQTKWVAEQIVISAMRNGLPTIISRCGNISGCRNSGSWNTNDMNLLILQGVIITGKAPNIPWQIELTPVDFTADIIVKLTRNWRKTYGKIFDIVNSRTLDCLKLWKLLEGKKYDINVVSYNEWTKAVTSASRNCKQLESLSRLLEVHASAEHLIKSSTFKQYNLDEFLLFLGIGYPQINIQLLDKYIDDLALAGYIPVGKRETSNDIMEKLYPRLKNKVAIVTGSSSGIGYAIAAALARAGITTVGIARNFDKLLELQQTLKAENVNCFVPKKVDITSRKEVFECVKMVQTTIGPVNILVNNAGVMEYCRMVNGDLDSWLDMVNVNCIGFLHMLAAVLPQMKDRQSGHIVNITSDAGRKPFINLAVYSGTKFFEEAVSEAMRQEIASYGIKVSNIQPGDVNSGMHQKSKDQEILQGLPDIEFLNVSEVAHMVLFVLDQPKNCAVNSILVEPLAGPI